MGKLMKNGICYSGGGSSSPGVSVDKIAVNYYSNDGTTLYFTEEYIKGNDAVNPTHLPPSISGKTFYGWSDKINLTSRLDSKLVDNQSFNLYAIYLDTVSSFQYTGFIQEFEAKSGVSYVLEVYGADGGNGMYTESGGKGGYSSGRKNFDQDTTLYVVVGGRGSTSTEFDLVTGKHTGGFNGGGDGNGHPDSENWKCGGGGGATHISTISGLLDDTEVRSGLLIAAGGGGGGGYRQDSSESNGGTGGGISGGDATPYGAYGKGGTQTEGGVNAIPSGYQSAPGSAGVGGTIPEVRESAGGGGGGYYGGSSGGYYNGGLPGGGGSGYIGGVSGGSTYNGINTSVDGCATITILSIS